MPEKRLIATVRMKPDDHRTIKAIYRNTYPAHGLSLNAWFVAMALNPANKPLVEDEKQ